MSEISVDRSLLEAAINELRLWKVARGGDDQVVLSLEAILNDEAAAHARAEASDQYKNVEPGKSWNAAYSSHVRARWREETIQILAELQHGFRDSDIEAIADRIHAAAEKEGGNG